MRNVVNGIVILAAVALGCGDKTVINGDKPTEIDYASPAKVLKTVELSFNEKNVEYLKEALSPNFIFYSDPKEEGRPDPRHNAPRPPPCYSYTEFWNVAYDMFNQAYDVSFSVDVGGVEEPAPEENGYSAGNVELTLLVMAEEKRGYVARGPCGFTFEKYRDEQGRDLWRIHDWYDKTEGGGEAPEGVERVPLWYILTLYE